MSVRVFSVAFAIAMVVLVGGCAKSGVAPPLVDNRATPAADPAPVAMGRQAWSGDWAIAVTGAKRKSSLDEVNAGKGNELLIVSLDIKNGGTNSGNLLASSLNLTDETGAEIEPVELESKKYLSEKPQALASGTRKTFTVVYRVPKGAGPFICRFWSPVESKPPAIVVIR